ncbi:MAG: LptF/LptG family permease, partial [Planctomycetales bacterium]
SFDYGARVRVTIHHRIVQPVLDLALLLMGLPLVMRDDSRNIYVSAGMCMGVAGAFVLVGMFCRGLGMVGFVSPVFAAWLPVKIFVPCAVYLSHSIWK